MSEQPDQAPTTDPAGAGEPHVVIVGPDGQPIATMPASALAGAGIEPATSTPAGSGDGAERSIADLVEQPAKVMRVGTMVRQLLEEVKAAPLDDASRNRLRDIHQASISELEAGLAPELVEELRRLSLPFTEDVTPSDGELRIAQAQLVGWLEGLFHGIQTAMYAQQMATRAQVEQVRRALPAGAAPGGAPQPGRPGRPGAPAAGGEDGDQAPGHGGGMYL